MDVGCAICKELETAREARQLEIFDGVNQHSMETVSPIVQNVSTGRYGSDETFEPSEHQGHNTVKTVNILLQCLQSSNIRSNQRTDPPAQLLARI